ncbi:phosphatidic acid phosphatase type 2/haloperoxidase, partial [Blastocladiella britannica]
TPFQRDFDVNDFSISHPFATKEIVPGNLLIVESTIAPALVLAAWAYYRQLSLREIVYALNCMLTAITMTMAITDTTKEFVGELRPDFLSRCAPVKDDAGKYVCTGDTKFVNEGRASFPSGHSSLSFAGWFSLILFANGTMSPLLRRNAWIKTVLVLLIVPAAFTALSRSRDYRHHWQDIFVGSLLGTVVAYFWYHVTYHPP